jgi:16S rRNA C967 or C1407 C5-methylase (RsmB/RsmF family)
MLSKEAGLSLGIPLVECAFLPVCSSIPRRASPASPPFSPSLRNFTRDAHVENLLLFPPQARLIDTSEYSDGRLILQDKASCFPAVVLAPPTHRGSVIIDATAAPGNKTSHLSALMDNQGKVQTPCLFRVDVLDYSFVRSFFLAYR